MLVFNMTKMILKSVFGKPATLMYPVKTREFPKNTRGKIEVEIEKCIFCGICQRKCPTGAIEINKINKKWSIERFKCIACNYCVDVCPKKCLVNKNEYTKPSDTKNREVFSSARVSNN